MHLTFEAYLTFSTLKSCFFGLILCSVFCLFADSSEGSFVGATPLPAAAAAAIDALASGFPSGSFVYPEDQYAEGVKISGSSSLGKRPVSRVLFDDEKKCMYLWGLTTIIVIYLVDLCCLHRMQLVDVN